MKSSSLPRWTAVVGTAVVAMTAGVMIGRVSSEGEAGNSKGRSGASEAETRISDRLASIEERQKQRRAGEKSSHAANAEKDISGILDATSRLERTQRLLAYLDQLPTEKFAGVYEEFRNNPIAKLRGSELSLVLQAWAERDPHAALGFLQEKGAQDWERETTVSTWASKDPQAAFEWAKITPEEGRVNNWLLGAARGIAATNPELARDYLSQMEGETRNQALNALQPYVMQYGFEYASGWLANMTDPELRNQATRNMARDLANLDVNQAKEWAMAVTDPDTRRAVAGTVTDAWARTDVNGAKSWVDQLPDDMKGRGAEGVARYYAQADPATAGQWLDSMGNTPGLDRAKSIYIEETFRNSPQSSLEYVSRVSDQGGRDRLYWRYTMDWARRDANAARAWANANSTRIPRELVDRINR